MNTTTAGIRCRRQRVTVLFVDIVGYTAIISLRLPEYWLHPYGPVLKNLPMLAVLWLLYVVDRGDSRR